MASVSPRPNRPPKLGVVAGGGQLPVHVISACREQGRDHFVVAFRGFTDPATVAGVPHEWFDLGKVGAVLRRLKSEQVREVVLAGPVRRPESLKALRIDWRGFLLLLRMLRDWRGDNHILSQVVREIERDGFDVVGAEKIADDLLMPAGPLGAFQPDVSHKRDIEIGVAAARDLGRRDRGQAVIVAAGRVIGRESAQGTAALLLNGSRHPEIKGGVLVKISKPGQERRVDLPSVGMDTVNQAAAGGLAGIALEARGSLVIGRNDVARAADAAGLFVVGIDVPAEPRHE